MNLNNRIVKHSCTSTILHSIFSKSSGEIFRNVACWSRPTTLFQWLHTTKKCVYDVAGEDNIVGQYEVSTGKCLDYYNFNFQWEMNVNTYLKGNLGVSTLWDLEMADFRFESHESKLRCHAGSSSAFDEERCNNRFIYEYAQLHRAPPYRFGIHTLLLRMPIRLSLAELPIRLHFANWWVPQNSRQPLFVSI